jgi:hypothetical protein
MLLQESGIGNRKKLNFRFLPPGFSKPELREAVSDFARRTPIFASTRRSGGFAGCNPKWREGFSGRRIALCEEEMEVQCGVQGSELIDFHHLYFYHTHGIPCLENCGVQGNHSPAGGV